MELAALLVIPAIASGLSLSPLGRRFAAPVALVASAIVLVSRSGSCRGRRPNGARRNARPIADLRRARRARPTARLPGRIYCSAVILGPRWVYVELRLGGAEVVPPISGLVHGPSVDWHEREIEDLFGLSFEGHPRLGEFVLHEDWPEGISPMLRDFDARQPLANRASEARCRPPTVVAAPGAFAMPRR